ncbi:MAG: YbhB/YbcL family Raf kinase inhibitor-like protein [Myxococcales bacterium]
MQLHETQHVMRSLLRGIPYLLTGGVPRERAGEQRLAFRRLAAAPSSDLRLTSDAFANGEPIPIRYTADGGGAEPPLRFSGVPQRARSLALVVEDPDAPTPLPFLHWLVYAIPPSAKSLDAARAGGAREGRTSLFTTGWVGCAPPKGDLAHRYFFQLFAVDRGLDLRPGAGRSALLRAMSGHVLSCATLIGTYRR